jgi:hypothetical protein
MFCNKLTAADLHPVQHTDPQMPAAHLSSSTLLSRSASMAPITCRSRSMVSGDAQHRGCSTIGCPEAPLLPAAAGAWPTGGRPATEGGTGINCGVRLICTCNHTPNTCAGEQVRQYAPGQTSVPMCHGFSPPAGTPPKRLCNNCWKVHATRQGRCHPQQT